MKIRSLYTTLALASGIMLSSFANMSWWPGIAIINLSVLCYLCILNRSGDPVKAFKAGKWHTTWVVLLFCGIGMMDEYNNRPISLEESYTDGIPENITGEIISILPKTYGDRLEIDLTGTNGAKALIMTGATNFSTGEIISFPSSRLREIANDTTKAVKNIAPMLKSNGVLYSGFIPKKYISECGRAYSFRNICMNVRNDIEIRIERSHLKKETSDFIKAILMGDKSGLNEETRLTFANGGVAHILALSGMHMGILAGILMWIMWPFRALGKYKWGYAVAILLLWCYVFVTGMSHSSVRACIMITFAFLAIIMERKNSVGHALCSACMLILLITPSALFDAGFQLSVVCVASLITFATRLNPIRQRQHPGLFRVCEALLATIVATIASWAFVSYYFSQVPLMFLPTNLLLLPLLPAYLSIGVIYTLLICLGIELSFLNIILDQGYRFLLWGAETLSSGDSYILDYPIPLYGLVIWIFILAIAAISFHRKS